MPAPARTIPGTVATFAVLIAALAAPAFAAGDATKGAATFRKCKSCHSVIAPDGTALETGGKTGPNLYAVIGRPVASTDFDYGQSIRAVGGTGAVWTEAELAEYVANPSEWLKEKLADPAAKSNMGFKLPKGGADVAAYLASLTP